MNPALPPNLINPAFEELDEAAERDDVNFAKDTAFLFQCWQSYQIQSNFAGDLSAPRARNLFWRIWSNPNLRTVSNQEFNQLWQGCRGQLDMTPYRPDPVLWQKLVGPPKRPVSLQLALSPLPPDLDVLPTPLSPRAAKITFDEQSLHAPARTTRDRNSSGGSGQGSSRPAYRRTGSARAISTAATRGNRTRPGLPRRRSSQNRPNNQRTSDQAVPRAEAGEGTNDGLRPERPRATFDLSSSWQSDDEEAAEVAIQSPSIEPNGSLVDSNFRSKFVENQRQLSMGTSLPAGSAMRKVRSSVRFADDTEDPTGSFKDKEVGKEPEPARDRANSQVFADSDSSEEEFEAPGLPRVQSQLSMLIKTKRQQSGSHDLGPSQPESDKLAETRKKNEELLRIGREAAKPIIPRSRRGSKERIDSRFRSPSPGATF